MEDIKYLGESEVDIKDTPYANYKAKDWAMEFIFAYGQIDGAHHKQWVLDQVARILKGTKVKVTLAKWSNGSQEYRFNLEKPSKKYREWVKLCRGEYTEEGGYEYGYDEGIAP